MKNTDINTNTYISQEIDLSEFSSADFAAWKAAAIQALKGAPFEKVLQRRNLDDMLLDAIFCRDTHGQSALVHTSELVRGDVSKEPWQIAQVCRMNAPDEFASIVIDALRKGQTEIRVGIRQAYAHGGAIHAAATDTFSLLDGELAIDDLSSFRVALPDGVKDERVQFHGDGLGVALLAFWVALHTERQWDIGLWRGGLGFSPISHLAFMGTLAGDSGRVFDEVHAVVEWMRLYSPKARALLVDGTVYHNGGASPAMELACCLGEAAVYLREMVGRGCDATDVANSVSVQLAVGDDFFEDIAKLRAMRLLLRGLAKAMGAVEPLDIRLMARTSQLFATRDEPLTNVLRTISATVSGALAGAASIHAAPFNECFAPWDEFAARISRNAQVILQKECGIGDVTDPCGGAYYVEHLTHELAKKAWQRLQQLEAHPGGFVGALQHGTLASQIDDDFQKRLQLLNKRKYKMVGVNDFVAFDDADNAFKRGGDARVRTAAVFETHTTTGPTLKVDAMGNAVADAVQAIQDGATLSQLDAEVKGEGAWTVVPIAQHRLAKGYEKLRAAVAALNAMREKPCSVLLLRLGTIRESKARTDFSRSFFNPAGFVVSESPVCADVEAARKAVKKADADIVVFCSTDEKYAEIATELASHISTDVSASIVLAGRPGNMEDAYRASGISEFIYLGADHFALLSSFVASYGENHG
ncbi:MAG: hypothetical protein JXR76_15160 [Deltaproteobacteria bacterium]|nr:hypothetical protein [Deltaproteobacteria bacterium]